MSVSPQTTPSNQRSFRRKLRGLVINGAILVITLSICLILLELAVRWFLPGFDPKRQIPFRKTANGGALGLPSQTVRQRTPKGDYDLPITFNADGFRDSRDFRQSRPEDWYVLGDSFSFGWGVTEDQRFSNVLDRYFQSNGMPVRVFNIAIPENILGYQRILAYAENLGANARHLVVGICMENDLRDYTDGRSAADGYLERGPRKELVRAWFKDHSALYIATSFVLQSSSWSRRLFQKVGISRDVQGLSGKNEWNPKVLQSSRDEVLKLVSGRNAVILIIPARRLWHGDNMETEKRVHDTFIGLLREAGLRVVDMRPVFEQTADPLAHYFKTDPHWNAQGHAVAGGELFKALATSANTKQENSLAAP